MKADLERAWRGLGNPVRRQILDMLRDGPETTGAIAAAFPELSRYAVMQHLGVLEESGLLLVRPEGRKRLNYLNAIPLQMIYERWVSGHASVQAGLVMELKRHVEKEERAMERTADRVVKIETEVRLNAPAEKVYEALRTGLDAWWPHRFRSDGKVVVEPGLGGRWYEDWGNGEGAVIATCVYLEAGRKVAWFGNGCMNNGYTSTTWETVIPNGDGCIYRRTNTMWGDVPEETEKMFREGVKSLTEKHLREYVEEGKTYQP